MCGGTKNNNLMTYSLLSLQVKGLENLTAFGKVTYKNVMSSFLLDSIYSIQA